MRGAVIERRGRLTIAAGAAALAVMAVLAPVRRGTELALLVQAHDAAAAAHAVRAVGGTVTHDLAVIDGVGAQVPAERLEQLRAQRGVRVFVDQKLEVAGSRVAEASFAPGLIGADLVHAAGITGKGVTIAILDTGYWGNAGALHDEANDFRILAGFNAITNRVGLRLNVDDASGHGTHIFGTAADSNYRTVNGVRFFNGIAPGASVVVVQAFDRNGAGSYASVIRGIDWILANRTRFGIRVLNCSFAAPARSHYWDDPLDQAIMRVWRAGIVVVASAGNTGPGPMTIGVPGNVPYVITVGAMTDNYTPADKSDDHLASFSAAGPTVEGFAKPDVVAPGGHVVALMKRSDAIPSAHPQFAVGASYFRMSGTSQAAAVVSGLAALVLQHDPTLTPDDVKCAILGTARAFKDASGAAAYSVFQQGAGVVSAWDAVNDGPTGCANVGLDVRRDLAGVEHYGGNATRDALGNYYLLDQVGGEGTTWSGGFPWSSGYPWSAGYTWSSGYPWSNGYPWSSGYDSASDDDGRTGYATGGGCGRGPAINRWVAQE